MKRSKRILAVFLAITLMVLPLMSQRGAYEVYAESADDSTATNDKEGTGLKDSQDQSLQDGSSQNTETNAETEVSKESGEESKEGLDKQKETEEKEPTSTEPQVKKQEKTALEASSPNVTNNDLNISKVKIIGDASNISVPNSISVELTVTGEAKDRMNHIHLYYHCSETGKGLNVNAYDFEWEYRQGTNYSTYTIRNIELNQYFAKGNYKLQSIEMNAASYNINVNYSYDSETKKFTCTENGDSFDYLGEADFTVTSNTEEDNIAPEILSAKKITEGPVYSDTQIEYEVGIKEETSGISNIQMIFQDKNDEVICCEANDIPAGETTAILTTSEGSSALPGEYKLRYMNVEDYAGNIASYQVSESNATQMTGFINGEEKTVTVKDNKITVDVFKAESLTVTDIRFADNVNHMNVAAGDTLTVNIKVKNPTDKQLLVQPKYCNLEWCKREPDGGYEQTYSVKLEGESKVLKPGEIINLSGHLPVSKYISAGSKEFLDMWITGYSENGKELLTHYYPTYNGNQFVGSNQTGQVIDVFPYNGELDFTVTKAEQADEEAPIIESITVAEKSLKAPGPITFKIKLKGEEVAPVTDIGFRVFGESGYNMFFGAEFEQQVEEERAKLSYSKEEGCYIYKQELDPLAIAETYQIDYVWILDEAGNSNTYYLENGVLADFEDNVISNAQFTVAETEAQDSDAKGPALKNVKAITSQTKPTDEFQVEFEVEDEMGVADVEVTYKNSISQQSSRAMDAISIDRNRYTCTFSLDKYCAAGEFTLNEIVFMDGSVRKNIRLYDYMDDGFYDAQTMEKVLTSEPVKLTVLPTEKYVITTVDEVLNDAADIAEGGTVVIGGIDAEMTEPMALPEQFISQAVEKKLTVIIPSVYGMSEVLIKGSDLAALKNKDYTIAVNQYEWFNEEMTVGNKVNDMFCPIEVVTSDKTVPVTIRIKLDKDFIEACGGKGITFSREGNFGKNEIIAENLVPDAEGYVEVALSGGWDAVNSNAKMLNLSSIGNETEEVQFYISAKSVEQGEYKLGDVNGDGEIKMNDLHLCMKHVMGEELLNGTKFNAADINQDGNVKMNDLMSMLRYITGESDVLG
jgi:hypothetical protein